MTLSALFQNHLHENGESAEAIASLAPIQAPTSIDSSSPLTDYFISSSHNTYLLQDQLFGGASADSYIKVIRDQARCVEIDLWGTPAGLRVTHGHTFTKSVPFRDVCEAISSSVKEDDWPLLVSLECHADDPGQDEAVKIMEEIWGDRLVRKAIKPGSQVVSPGELKGKIVLMVEWYPPISQDQDPHHSEDSSSSSDSDFSDSPGSQHLRQIRQGGKAKSQQTKVKITKSLSRLGVYANSIKTKKGFLAKEITDPLFALINISETALLHLLPASAVDLISHAKKHLRRCYPRGTRVRSSNMDPLKAWSNGTQIAALNWQIYDDGMQLNRAMFAGSPGWVLKPASLRDSSVRGGPKEKVTLSCEIFGASNIPDAPNASTYIIADLFHPQQGQKWRSKTVKDHGGEPVWSERFEWVYEEEDIVFVRLRIWQDKLGADDWLGVYTFRVQYLPSGDAQWRVLPLLGKTAEPNGAAMLVRLGVSTSS